MNKRGPRVAVTCRGMIKRGKEGPLKFHYSHGAAKNIGGVKAQKSIDSGHPSFRVGNKRGERLEGGGGEQLFTQAGLSRGKKKKKIGKREREFRFS